MIKLKWLTSKGKVNIGDGELAPPLTEIELRAYPEIGFALSDWTFDYGFMDTNGKLVKFEVEKYDFLDKCFVIKLQFDKIFQPTHFVLRAIRRVGKETFNVFSGRILPNIHEIRLKSSGIYNGNFDLKENMSQDAPNADYRHFVLPDVTLLIPENSSLYAKACSEFEHVKTNAPIVLKGFHPEQSFNIEVRGHVVGFGGKGGNNGYVLDNNGGIEIVYPTNGLMGGDPVYLEHPGTQSVKVKLYKSTGLWEAGKGGGKASGFNSDSIYRDRLIGLPGIGGYPNGLNGKVTGVPSGFKSVHPYVATKTTDKKLIFVYVEGVVTSKTNYVKDGSYIDTSKDGQDGNPLPEGVTFVNKLKRVK